MQHQPLLALDGVSDFLVIDRAGGGPNCHEVRLEEAGVIELQARRRSNDPIAKACHVAANRGFGCHMTVHPVMMDRYCVQDGAGYKMKSDVARVAIPVNWIANSASVSVSVFP